MIIDCFKNSFNRLGYKPKSNQMLVQMRSRIVLMLLCHLRTRKMKKAKDSKETYVELGTSEMNKAGGSLMS